MQKVFIVKKILSVYTKVFGHLPAHSTRTNLKETKKSNYHVIINTDRLIRHVHSLYQPLIV